MKKPFFLVSNLLREETTGLQREIRGWVLTVRRQKRVSFVRVSDGSNWDGVQVVAPSEGVPAGASTGSSVVVKGITQRSPRGDLEILADGIDLIGGCDAKEYPLQKKMHSLEHLRNHMHLRSRGRRIGAILRVRSAASFAAHEFFNDRGFTQIHTPVLTSIDCEGAGDMFQVNTNVGGSDENRRATSTFLTVSGQLHLEPFAMSLSNVYSFGPAFRAENSNTSRHLSEFWMLEPEMAHYDLMNSMDLAEKFVKESLDKVYSRRSEDVDYLLMEDEQSHQDFETTRTNAFYRMTYDEAVDELVRVNHSHFENKVSRGQDLKKEHEDFLVEKVCERTPVFITNYPSDCKAFYMRQDPTDSTRVRCFDLLIPRIGELIGGSERETDEENLKSRMSPMQLRSLQWYLDLRRFGSVPHAGWGLGFERFVQFLTGARNIRETAAMPRWPNSVEF